MWWTLHVLDWLFFDRFAPEYSFGLSTLTSYPQAGEGGSNTTCDGSVGVYSVAGLSWVNLLGDTGNQVNNTSDTNEVAYLQVTSTLYSYNALYRSCYTFDNWRI